MKVSAIFNSDGSIKGFYPEDIWPTPPQGSVEITVSEWNNLVSFPQNFKLVSGKVARVNVDDEVSYPLTISDRQFYQQLSVDGIITQQEALKAVRSGDLPQAVLDILNTLPADDLFNAEMLLSGATSFQINNPLTETFSQKLGWDNNKLIQFWTKASKL